jgi:hypothetical protein
MQQLVSRSIFMRPMRTRATKEELVQALRRSEARSVSLAAENDRLRHALEIEKANNLFAVVRDSSLRSE